ncbi:DUF6177 family protein [Streptomyces sp. NPDC005279]|uniref:DUF6177 family protein n=1 Tax=Streptomyces sp. NPDC005279 TaxID=3364712 RepID=UPI0036B30A84
MTSLARNRAPRPTWLLTVGSPGRPAIATLRIRRTELGIEEEITFTAGYGADEEAPLDAIESLAEMLATRHGLTSMIASLRTARRDLTVPPRLEAPPVPIAFTLGPDSVHDIGRTHASRPPLNLRPAQLGPAARPALRYLLGDGTKAPAWTVLQQLIRHLKKAQMPGEGESAARRFESVFRAGEIALVPFDSVQPGPIRDAFGTQGQEQTDKDEAAPTRLAASDLQQRRGSA